MKTQAPPLLPPLQGEEACWWPPGDKTLQEAQEALETRSPTTPSSIAHEMGPCIAVLLLTRDLWGVLPPTRGDLAPFSWPLASRLLNGGRGSTLPVILWTARNKNSNPLTFNTDVPSDLIPQSIINAVPGHPNMLKGSHRFQGSCPPQNAQMLCKLI